MQKIQILGEVVARRSRMVVVAGGLWDRSDGHLEVDSNGTAGTQRMRMQNNRVGGDL